jgi:hypothetical protein
MKALLIAILELILAWLRGDDPPPIDPPPVDPPDDPPPWEGPEFWDERLTELGITCEVRNGNRHLLAAWLTKNGSWDDVPAFAKQWQQDTLGGDHNAYLRIETPGGEVIHDRLCMAWPPYGEDQGAVAYPEHPSGWGNFIMAGQNWTPANGPGPYVVWCDAGDKLWGLGMPNNQHWSFFGVWVEEA